MKLRVGGQTLKYPREECILLTDPHDSYIPTYDPHPFIYGDGLFHEILEEFPPVAWWNYQSREGNGAWEGTKTATTRQPWRAWTGRPVNLNKKKSRSTKTGRAPAFKCNLGGHSWKLRPMRPMATRDFRNGCLCPEIFLRAQRRARAKVWKFVHLMDHFGTLRTLLQIWSYGSFDVFRCSKMGVLQRPWIRTRQVQLGCDAIGSSCNGLLRRSSSRLPPCWTSPSPLCGSVFSEFMIPSGYVKIAIENGPL